MNHSISYCISSCNVKPSKTMSAELLQERYWGFSQSHRCLFVITQPSNMSQRSSTDYSSHHRASTSEVQMFSSSWMRESMACPVKEAASSMLANTCLYSCSGSGSISLRPHSYGKEENILIEVVGSQPPLVKLSGSHMALAGDKEKTCTWWSCWVLLEPDGSCGGGGYWQMNRYGTLGEYSSNCWWFLNMVKYAFGTGTVHSHLLATHVCVWFHNWAVNNILAFVCVNWFFYFPWWCAVWW